MITNEDVKSSIPIKSSVNRRVKMEAALRHTLDELKKHGELNTFYDHIEAISFAHAETLCKRGEVEYILIEEHYDGKVINYENLN